MVVVLSSFSTWLQINPLYSRIHSSVDDHSPTLRSQSWRDGAPKHLAWEATGGYIQENHRMGSGEPALRACMQAQRPHTVCQFSWYKHSMRANFTYQYDFMNKNWQEMYTDQFSEADKWHLQYNTGLSVKSFTHLPPWFMFYLISVFDKT